MKKTRNCVFETNSSSTHSISINEISDEFILDTIIPDEEGNIYLKGGEFGWEWKKFNDALTKANYYLVDNFNDEDKINNLKEIIKTQTGALDVIIFTDNEKYNSYIDHQSYNTTNNIIDLKDFVFNKANWLFTGNDNDCAPNKFYDTKKEIYTHKLIVKGFKNSNEIVNWEFKKKPKFSEIKEVISDLLFRIKFDINKKVALTNYYPNKSYYEFDYLKNKENKENNKNVIFSKCHDILYKETEGLYKLENTTISERDWCFNKVKEFKNLPENIIYLPYEIIRI